MGIGSCLLQDGKPVEFASHALTDAESRYAKIEMELLAIVFACIKVHQYIYSRPFVVHNYHKPLEAIFQKLIALTTSRLQRMLLRLLEYDITVQYTPGKQMYIADTLLRSYLEKEPSSRVEREIAEDMSYRLTRSSQTLPSVIPELTRSGRSVFRISKCNFYVSICIMNSHGIIPSCLAVFVYTVLLPTIFMSKTV